VPAPDGSRARSSHDQRSISRPKRATELAVSTRARKFKIQFSG
jgi:hypothetical protein